MTIIRAIFWIVGTLAAGYAMAALWLLPWLDFGVAVAVCSACVIGLGLVRAIEADKRREADKARHPAIWTPPGGLREGTITTSHGTAAAWNVGGAVAQRISATNVLTALWFPARSTGW
jgi:hypothetical protein